MTRAGVCLILALAAFGSVRSGGGDGAPAVAASPVATPLTSYGGFAIPGAVPVSLLIENDGAETDRLVGASSPVAERFEVHRTLLVEGRRVMHILGGGLDIPPGASLLLEPGADHLMLFGPRVTLVQGDTFPLTLHFLRAGNIAVTGRVRRKVDSAGITPYPPVVAGGIGVSLVSAPPAPAVTSFATPHP